LCPAEWNEEITEGLYNGLKQLFLIMKSQQNILFAGMFQGVLSLFMVRKNATNAKCRCNNRNWMCDETKHFDFVCEGVTQGIKDLNVQSDVPVIFAF
jgi:6,7-dimethyl-8-ribityllumazine synthase